MARFDGPEATPGNPPDVLDREHPLADPEAIQALLARLPDVAVLAYDRDLRFTAAGGPGLEAQGWDPAELLGRRLEELVSPNDELAVRYRAALAGETQSFHYHGVRRPERTNAVDIVPLRGAGGEVIGGLVVARDVTDELERMAALTRSEQRLRQLTETAGDMLALYDLDGIYLEVSPASEELFGWRPEQLVGTPSYDLFHPDDVAAIRAVHDAVLAGPRGGTATYRLRCADGSYRWVEVRGRTVPDPQTGEPAAIQCTTRDISDRREAEDRLQESEARFRAALANAPIGMALVGLDGRFLEVNDALCRIVGRGTEELLATDFQSITHPDDLEADLSLLEEVIAGRRLDYEMEKRYLRGDGTYVPCELHVAVIRSPDGRPTHVIGQVVDISERKAVESQLRDLNAELLRSNGELERFAVVTSHDLRSPLATLRGLLSHLLESGADLDDDSVRQLLDAADGLTAKMAASVDGLLSLARVERGPLELQTVDLASLVQETTVALEPEIRGAEADIRVHDLPQVEGDPRLLGLLLQNLLANALRMRHPDRPLVIDLTAARNATSWQISVSDTGQGFGPGEREALFEPFVRGGNGGAIGIGLATCRRIVERHGGSFSAEGDGEGARFVFTLPAT
ncbi:PAS domain S-box protein [Egicoccus sp. AB-alg2]|uniref:PAS domain S-box protein n=1 Tax=Egicoccus sp. AB-alg2 TaxID=3242693 RepID=UPI00359D15FA